MQKKRIIPPSELIINDDGSIFHLHLKPEQLADKVFLVGDPSRVTMVATFFDEIEYDVSSREFHTITGTYKGKRITVLSHGIGTDNIDIVITELDALANIDFKTRQVKDTFRQLTLVRVGTSGGLQPDLSLGSYVAAEKSIGFDPVLYFYENSESIRDLPFEEALLKELNWKIKKFQPYVVSASTSLIEQICQDDIKKGVTIASCGFYGPQGRYVRLPIAAENLNATVEAFHYQDYRITNYEMESSSLAGLSALMGHRAMTVCCIIAGRVKQDMNTNYKTALHTLIEKVLTRI